MKTYCGSPASARTYVESGRARADRYYLTDGTGIADRYAASPAAGVRRLEPLTSHEYEAWVAGLLPERGEPRSRLRNDACAVRFVELSVNGPKSWSLAAELHPGISVAYDAAQGATARQMVGLAGAARDHPRRFTRPTNPDCGYRDRRDDGGAPHLRAGDPHWALHLQINAQVLAEGSRRGLHTVGVRDSIDVINGIGHAAMMTDPRFRPALASRFAIMD